MAGDVYVKAYRRKIHFDGDGKMFVHLPQELIKQWDLLPGDELIFVQESEYEWLLHRGKRK